MQETTGSEFEHLIEIYSPILLNKAYYLLSNKEDAEDIVQEVFISAYVNYHLFKNKSSIKSWLMGILYNKVMDAYKKRYKQGNKLLINFDSDFDKHGEWNHNEVVNTWNIEDNNERDNLLDNIDFRDQFFGCIEALPERWRIVVKLCYLQENKAE